MCINDKPLRRIPDIVEGITSHQGQVASGATRQNYSFAYDRLSKNLDFHFHDLLDNLVTSFDAFIRTGSNAMKTLQRSPPQSIRIDCRDVPLLQFNCYMHWQGFMAATGINHRHKTGRLIGYVAIPSFSSPSAGAVCRWIWSPGPIGAPRPQATCSRKRAHRSHTSAMEIEVYGTPEKVPLIKVSVATAGGNRTAPEIRERCHRVFMRN